MVDGLFIDVLICLTQMCYFPSMLDCELVINLGFTVHRGVDDVFASSHTYLLSSFPLRCVVRSLFFTELDPTIHNYCSTKIDLPMSLP